MPYYEGALLKSRDGDNRHARRASRYGSSPVESAVEMFEEGDRVQDHDGNVAVVVEVLADGTMRVDEWPAKGQNIERVLASNWTHT